MITLAELEALPELKTSPNKCMRCGASINCVSMEVIVYRHPIQGNVSFTEARHNDEVEEIKTAEICIKCNDELCP